MKSIKKRVPAIMKSLSWMTTILLTVAICWMDTSAQQLAFPGAEGFGRYTTGGRGGDVYVVTNLNDGGEGSLRYAVEQSGPRIVVFAISGTIHLTSQLSIGNGDLTIFGQTAPGQGIATKGYGVQVSADNVIIQYMRFRPGDISAGEPDAIWGKNQKDIILDHCSMSWSIDETSSFYDNENFTMQWCILSESLYDSNHEKGEHGYGGIWGGQGATFHHNLLAHHSSRNPRFNGARYTGASDLEIVDYRNNVIYNWGGNSAYGGEQGNHNMVANYYKAGPATTDSQKRYRILDANPPSGGIENSGEWYIEDNYVDGFPNVTADNWDGGIQRIPEVEFSRIRVYEPFQAPVLPSFETAEEAYINVLRNAGAVLPARDTVDARIMYEVENGITHFGGNYGANSGIIDSQEEVGGWPELLSAPPRTDTDGDGIPDEWETENGLDPDDASDGSAINETGYSNLESYVHTITEADNQFVPVPGSAELNYPVREDDVPITAQFKWTSAAHADLYQMEIRDGAGDYADVLLDTVVSDTTFQIPDELQLEGSTTYFWRVRASNDAGYGSWTGYEYFITEVVTSIDENNQHVPTQPKLQQNYPNPFNPSTVIHYTLPERAEVSITIHDLTGRKIAELFSGVKASGSHKIQFNASTLSSGIYVYTLHAQMLDSKGTNYLYNESKKMTVIK